MTRSTISKSFMSVLGTVVKVTLWSFMALALFVAGSLVMVVNVLSPERLTPIVEHFASKSVNADVHLGKATLDFRSSAPFLMLTLEDLYVVSRDMRELPDSLRNMIPAQADTLFSLKKFSGGINLIHLAKGKINMRQVVFDSPSVFIADVAPGITNYDIIKDSPEKEQSDTTDMYVPEIEFDSFRIINPGPVRYHNFQTGDSALLDIAAISLKGDEAPLYHMEIVTSMESGLFDRYNIKDMVFALDGGIRWSKSAPAIIDLVDFNLRVAFLDIKADTRINFENGLVIEKMEAAVSSLKLKDIVAIIPTEVRHDAGIDRLSTDARIDMDIVLDAPYDPVSDTLPAATVKMSVAPCRIDIGKLHIGTFYTDIIFKNVDNNMDNATLFIDKFFMRGDRRGLDISASGTVTRLLSDPLFDGRISGNIHLSYLPEALTDKLGGHLS
ncbi:MAG: hypothetical protein K2O12_00845, partial [Muribaculaceae bacterium]|nr:hypothetical protein [Muribaculaceae bacterium]